MNFEISVNHAKVVDRDKALEVCDRFDFNGACLSIDEDRNVRVSVDDVPDGDDPLPLALPVDKLPDRDAFDNEDRYWDHEFQAFYSDGNEGFVSFLQDLAPCLESPLFILAFMRDKGATAAAWYVEPNGKVHVLTTGPD